MEISKKLDTFYASSIEVANKKSSSMIRDYTRSMEKLFEDFRRQKQEEINSLAQIEEEKIRREVNREVSEALTEQKRKLNLRQQEKKDILFSRVVQMLKEYQKTDSYERLLCSKIQMAERFAKQEPVTIYLAPGDAEKKERLEQKTGCELTVSEIDFYGGIRAVIRSLNVLIDESFYTKLSREMDDYTF